MFSPLVWSFAICCIISATTAEEYITKYDNIDLDDIFQSTRLMNNYMNCLKNLGPCTPDGTELKEKLPDALESDCEHCSERQKIGASKVIHFIVQNRPTDFEILESLYDPSGEYRRKYLDDQLNFRLPLSDDSGSDEEKSSGESSTEETVAQDHGQSEGH